MPFAPSLAIESFRSPAVLPSFSAVYHNVPQLTWSRKSAPHESSLLTSLLTSLLYPLT